MRLCAREGTLFHLRGVRWRAGDSSDILATPCCRMLPTHFLVSAPAWLYPRLVSFTKVRTSGMQKPRLTFASVIAILLSTCGMCKSGDIALFRFDGGFLNDGPRGYVFLDTGKMPNRTTTDDGLEPFTRVTRYIYESGPFGGGVDDSTTDDTLPRYMHNLAFSRVVVTTFTSTLDPPLFEPYSGIDIYIENEPSRGELGGRTPFITLVQPPELTIATGVTSAQPLANFIDDFNFWQSVYGEAGFDGQRPFQIVNPVVERVELTEISGLSFTVEPDGHWMNATFTPSINMFDGSQFRVRPSHLAISLDLDSFNFINQVKSVPNSPQNRWVIYSGRFGGNGPLPLPIVDPPIDGSHTFRTISQNADGYARVDPLLEADTLPFYWGVNGPPDQDGQLVFDDAPAWVEEFWTSDREFVQFDTRLVGVKGNVAVELDSDFITGQGATFENFRFYWKTNSRFASPAGGVGPWAFYSTLDPSQVPPITGGGIFDVRFDLLPPFSKEIIDGPDRDDDGEIDRVVGVTSRETSEYTFKITFHESELPPALIQDVIPREWELVGCEPEHAGDLVTWWSTGRRKHRGYRETLIQWLPTNNDSCLTCTVRLRHHNHRQYEPHESGCLLLNGGAEAFDTAGEDALLDKDGQALVTESLSVVALTDHNRDGVIDYSGNGDEDGDTLTDWFEACVLGTDPCDRDTDHDRVPDAEDPDPLDRHVPGRARR